MHHFKGDNEILQRAMDKVISDPHYCVGQKYNKCNEVAARFIYNASFGTKIKLVQFLRLIICHTY